LTTTIDAITKIAASKKIVFSRPLPIEDYFVLENVELKIELDGTHALMRKMDSCKIKAV
jgi:hypothetical protein